MEYRPAGFSYDAESHAYYFKPSHRVSPPYRKQIRVEAIIDVAEDGTLAGVEIIDQRAPKPPTLPEPHPLQVNATPHEGPQSTLDEPIEFLPGLSTRAANAILHHNAGCRDMKLWPSAKPYKTLRDLHNATDAELLRLHYFGRACLREVRELIATAEKEQHGRRRILR